MTNPNFGARTSEPIAAATPIAAKICPRTPEAIASRDTRKNECGFGGDGGTITYCLRPAHRTAVEINISAPGTPNATAGPRYRRNMGIRSDAKNEPKLMIQ